MLPSKGVDLKRGRAKNTFNVFSPYCVDNIFLEHIVLQNERKSSNLAWLLSES